MARALRTGFRRLLVLQIFAAFAVILGVSVLAPKDSQARVQP